ncbi:MAG: DUF6794 domain-containing protein [Candidatus Zixiibacteriota bacterium]
MNFRLGRVVALPFLVVFLLSICLSNSFAVHKRPYIPSDLNDCLAYLDTTLTPVDLDSLRQWHEDEMPRAHMNLGLWLRNNWGLWKGSRLSEWFNKHDIWHPDDMSGIILTSYWRHLHNRPIELDAQIAGYIEYWKDNTYPDTLKCPICRHKVKDEIEHGPGVDPDYPSVTTFVLYCKNNHPWFYSWSHGLYAIDSSKNHELLDTLKVRLPNR